jgi:PAS domain S-box-containing protein
MLLNENKTNQELVTEIQNLREQLAQAKAEAEELRREKTALAVLHANLHKLIQKLPVAVQVFDAAGLCQDVNQAYLSIFGVEQPELVIGVYNIFTDPHTKGSGIQAAARRALTGEVVHLPEVEFKLAPPDSRPIAANSHKILTVTLIPIRDVARKIVQIVALNEDITERKKAEQELRASEDLFRQVISSISDHIYVSEVTENGTRINVYLSPHVEAMTGYPHQKFLDDWTFWPNHVIHPDDRARARGQAAALAQGKDGEMEYRLIRADGQVIWVRDRARVKQKGTSLVIYALVSDITAHKLVELEREWLTNELRDINQTLDERVRARTAELQAILDAAGEGIVVTDLDGVIQYINPALERLTGCTENDALGHTPRLWNSNKHDKSFFRQMWQTIQAGQTWRGELVNRRRDGKLYDVLLTITPIPGPDGQPIGFVGMQNDITPFKEMDRLKSEFVSTAAHELRTPLTSIQGFSEILLTRELNQERKTRYLTFINQQAQALAAIIGDLLDVSRLESKQSFELAEQLVNIKDIVEQVLFGFQENHAQHQYRIEGPENWPPIKGDPAKLSQLFRNLFSNATKYSPNGGQVVLEVSVKTQYNLMHLVLSDEGVGMTSEQLSKVFERFYRADASNTAIGGTGLGMTISRLIVERHGGKIWVDSHFGAGTKVHVLLPLSNRPYHILVIEDDDVLREVQQRSLELQGYRVITANTGKIGLELAQTGLPDLILLDLALPGMTGFAVLDELRRRHISVDVPVIITSAMDKQEIIEQAISKGAVDYLVKPYSMSDLTVRVNRALVEIKRDADASN